MREKHRWLARALALGLDVPALMQNRGLALDLPCADPSDADTWLSRLTLYQYLELLDWTGRQLHPGKRGEIPESAPRSSSRRERAAAFG